MARKKNSENLTPLELELMEVLWATGPANVQTVQEQLKSRRDLAYTTVQTMLNVLHRKGKVTRKLKKRAYYYRPALSRDRAVSRAVSDLVDRLFGGSADDLVLNLIEAKQLTPKRLEELRRMIAEHPSTEEGDG